MVVLTALKEKEASFVNCSPLKQMQLEWATHPELLRAVTAKSGVGYALSTKLVPRLSQDSISATSML